LHSLQRYDRLMRQRCIPRPALLEASSSTWRKFYESNNDQAMITLTGFNFETFLWLLPYTAIIDGANVGYYMQNFQDGRFCYNQIKFVVCSRCIGTEAGETPLVLLPAKYTRNNFIKTKSFSGPLNGRDVYEHRQFLTESDMKIRDELMTLDKLFIVPTGLLDDFYWILASIATQTEAMASCGIDSLDVPSNNPQGQWPGRRPVVITNDKKRDHKLDYLNQFCFVDGSVIL
jgi:hypothetical protein